MRYRIIIPALNAASYLAACTLTAEQCRNTLLIDSASDDHTASLARQMGMTVMGIERSEFDHGQTRQRGAAWAVAAGAEFVVFLTQDALQLKPDAIEQLLKPFEDVTVAAVCARQIPRPQANPIEQHARWFNYPAVDRRIEPSDIQRIGIRAGFMSNSCAAYRLSALNSVGGFPAHCIFGEDMLTALRLLATGHVTYYASNAVTIHSHGYSLKEEFKRYFDVGVLHEQLYREFSTLGKAEGEGARFVTSELAYLLKHGVWLIPQACVRTALKYLAYTLGKKYRSLPNSLNARLSMNKRYWQR